MTTEVRKRVCGCFALAASLLLLAGCSNSRPWETDASAREVQSAEAAALGIETLALRQSSAGRLNLQYRVVDPKKAAAFRDRNARPYLVDQTTGAMLFPSAASEANPSQDGAAPKMGHVYFAVFVNPGKLVEPGKKVTLVVGDRRVPLVVRD